VPISARTNGSYENVKGRFANPAKRLANPLCARAHGKSQLPCIWAMTENPPGHCHLLAGFYGRVAYGRGVESWIDTIAAHPVPILQTGEVSWPRSGVHEPARSALAKDLMSPGQPIDDERRRRGRDGTRAGCASP